LVDKILFSILGYTEDGWHVAHALELDLKGYGKSPEAALKEVHGMVTAQLSFAHFKGNPSLAWRPAAQECFDRFAQLQREYSEARAAGEEPAPQTTCMPIPEPHVIAEMAESYAADG